MWSDGSQEDVKDNHVHDADVRKLAQSCFSR